MTNYKSIWLFHGATGRFASGAFDSIQEAENWIKEHSLTGVLTEYPVNIGVYDWAIQHDLFEVKKESQRSSEFIQSFTCAGQEHFHYELGVRD